jgi:hypothetical protein
MHTRRTTINYPFFVCVFTTPWVAGQDLLECWRAQQQRSLTPTYNRSYLPTSRRH